MLNDDNCQKQLQSNVIKAINIAIGKIQDMQNNLAIEILNNLSFLNGKEKGCSLI